MFREESLPWCASKALRDFEDWIEQRDTPKPRGLRNKRQAHSSPNCALEPVTAAISFYSRASVGVAGMLLILCWHSCSYSVAYWNRQVWEFVCLRWTKIGVHMRQRKKKTDCEKRGKKKKNCSRFFVRSRYHTRVTTPGWLETNSSEGYLSHVPCRETLNRQCAGTQTGPRHTHNTQP